MRKFLLAAVALIAVGVIYAKGNYDATQGTGTTFGSAVIGGVHFVEQLICDATVGTTCATVKAASTPPAATDPALVVSLSPNSAGVSSPDPCLALGSSKTYKPIAITTATTTAVVAAQSGKKIYICNFSVQTNAANNVALIEGTGGTCGSATIAGIYGGTTSGSGLNLTANEGIALGNGLSAVMASANVTQEVCIITSASTNLAGHMTWVAQ